MHAPVTAGKINKPDLSLPPPSSPPVVSFALAPWADAVLVCSAGAWLAPSYAALGSRWPPCCCAGWTSLKTRQASPGKSCPSAGLRSQQFLSLTFSDAVNSRGQTDFSAYQSALDTLIRKIHC